MQKFATFTADHLARIAIFMLVSGIFLNGLLLLLLSETRLSLPFATQPGLNSVLMFGQQWLALQPGQIISGQEQSITHLFTQPEVMVIRSLLLTLWTGMATLLSATIFLALQDRQRYRWHLVFGIVLCVMLFSAELPYLLTHGVSQPLLELVKLSVLLLCTLLINRALAMRPSATNRNSLIAYASQTGSAMQLAQQLHRSANHALDLRCLSRLTPACLSQYDQVLFVVSTQGDGQAPDSANRFIKALQAEPSLPGQPRFSILALGDRHYQSFCAFGHHLYKLLQSKGLQSFVPTVEVDRMDMGAVNHWWQHVSTAFGQVSSPQAMSYEVLTVMENRCLNPEQTHRHAHHLRLFKAGTHYQAGDLLAVKPRIQPEQIEQRLAQLGWSAHETVRYQNEARTLLELLQTLEWIDEQADSPQALVDQLKPIHERLYSIASCQADHLDLLVRRHLRQDHSIGHASGYLCGLKVGDQIEASVRTHATFHLPGDVPLIMIGAGTGLAPFMGFLQQKQSWRATTPNWLLFGEQYKAQDAYFAERLEHFQQLGVLTRLDCVWSRDDNEYVQDRLAQLSVTLLEWVEEHGAHIFVCGSREGFGESVLGTLEVLLDRDLLIARLHTDLY